MEIVFGITVGLVCGWILAYRPKKSEYDLPSEPVYRSPYPSEQDREDENKRLQMLEDNKMERQIEHAAETMYAEWCESIPVTIGDRTFRSPILLIRPFRSVYYIHHEPTARFTGKSLNDLVHKQFELLKAKHSKTGDHK